MELSPQIASVSFAKKKLEIEIILAGRSIEKAEVAAEALGNTRAVYLDCNTARPLEKYSHCTGAVLAAVNDPPPHASCDRAGYSCRHHRWTERLKAEETAQKLQPRRR
jgi:hypothetical protein